jgi:hypothetical protein
MSYREHYRRSIDDAEGFWREQALALPWQTVPTTIQGTDENGIHRWFVDGVMNTAYMALDHHVETGRADQLALIYDSPVTGQRHGKRLLTSVLNRKLVAIGFNLPSVQRSPCRASQSGTSGK